MNSRGNAGLSKSMKTLRWLLVLLTLMAAISILLSYVYLKVMFEDFTGRLNFIKDAGARVYHVASILYATQWLTSISSGIAYDSAATIAQEMYGTVFAQGNPFL